MEHLSRFVRTRRVHKPINSYRILIDNRDSCTCQLLIYFCNVKQKENMKEKGLPIGHVVGRMMGKIAKVLKRKLSEEEINITLEQLGLLHAISENKEEVAQQDMAEFMGKDKSAILRLIDSLEKKRLVVRTSDPQDRRKNVLVVTQHGKSTLTKVTEISTALNEKLLEGISQTDIDTFFTVAEKIKSNAEKMS